MVSAVFILADGNGEKSTKHIGRVAEVLPNVEAPTGQIDGQLLKSRVLFLLQVYLNRVGYIFECAAEWPLSGRSKPFAVVNSR